MAPIPIWCAGHIWERAIANLNLSIQNDCRDQGNTLNTLKEAAGMLETDLVLQLDCWTIRQVLKLC